ncbi:hypothetical protein F5Y18DRAFT_408771 [Xylariaceae sp. FL1019]|nr:hypothetical protein F5Y18DRAFT_408771 [Xylariaceae sp. FL1019]
MICEMTISENRSQSQCGSLRLFPSTQPNVSRSPQIPICEPSYPSVLGDSSTAPLRRVDTPVHQLIRRRPLTDNGPWPVGGLSRIESNIALSLYGQARHGSELHEFLMEKGGRYVGQTDEETHAVEFLRSILRDRVKLSSTTQNPDADGTFLYEGAPEDESFVRVDMSIWLGMKEKQVGNWKPFQPTNWLEINPHRINTSEHIGDPRLCTSCFRPCRSHVSEADDIVRRRAAAHPSQLIAGQYFDRPITATWDIKTWADQNLPRYIPSAFPDPLPNAVRRQFATPVRDGPTTSHSTMEEGVHIPQEPAANAQRARVVNSRGQSRACSPSPNVQNGAVKKSRGLSRGRGGVRFRIPGQSQGGEVEGKRLSSMPPARSPSIPPSPTQYRLARGLEQTLFVNVDTEGRDMMTLFQAPIPVPHEAQLLIPTNAPPLHSALKQETSEPQSSPEQACGFDLSDWVHDEDVSEPNPNCDTYSNIHHSTTRQCQ